MHEKDTSYLLKLKQILLIQNDVDDSSETKWTVKDLLRHAANILLRDRKKREARRVLGFGFGMKNKIPAIGEKTR